MLFYSKHLCTVESKLDVEGELTLSAYNSWMSWSVLSFVYCLTSNYHWRKKSPIKHATVMLQYWENKRKKKEDCISACFYTWTLIKFLLWCYPSCIAALSFLLIVTIVEIHMLVLDVSVCVSRAGLQIFKKARVLCNQNLFSEQCKFTSSVMEALLEC